MKNRNFAVIFAFLAFSTAAQAQIWGSAPAIGDYQLGSEWGKTAVTRKQLQAETAIFQRTAAATASLSGGTAFYLGRFDGHAIVATNHHVCENLKACVRLNARFPVLGKKAKVTKTLGSWPEIDLSLHIVDIDPKDEAAFAAVAQNFSFGNELYRGQPLITIGFGSAGNPYRQLMVGQDSDCKVFSDRGEFRFMHDPDGIKPGGYQAWSFSVGCDVSHGDSGSAMVDRLTGEIVGIIWSGRFPKIAAVQDSKFLDGLLIHPTEDIWTQLSYAVPAVSIKTFLQGIIQAQKPDPATAALLDRIVQ